MKRLLYLGLFTALSAGFLASSGCDTLIKDSGEYGKLTVLLTDEPFPYDLAEAANVTISRVELVTDGGVVIVTDVEQTFNLLELRDGVTALLGSVDVETGIYHQLRLIVTETSVDLIDGREFDLKIPSGFQTGIKVLLQGLEIKENEETVVTLDFDVDESFVVLGNTNSAAGIKGFLFKPVIKPSIEYEPVTEEEEEEEDEEEEVVVE